MAHAEHELLERLRKTRSQSGRTTTPVEPSLGASTEAKEIYFGLLQDQADPTVLAQSHSFLMQQLQQTEALTDNLPADIDDLPQWMQSNTMAIGRQYQNYLREREEGAPRRYFSSRAHALHFLQGVAPTKLVDGAWLYGLLQQWRDVRYHELIRIYLEELGDGDSCKNHVVLYKKLLASHDCMRWRALPAPYFLQGAIQLSLAEHTAELLPEVIGFNLGYEQLPLHLLICSYELRELGVDPYYFTLHITIDNAGTGHAARAIQAVFDALPDHADRSAFYRRMRRGYRLNDLGIGTNKVIESFKLEQEVVDILSTKATFGAFLHSDYCRIGGKTVNEWLSPPGQIPGFIAALQQAGWVKRHEDPNNSRFWKLLEGDKAPMFGVFNTYERQVIHDWIAGTSLSNGGNTSAAERHRPPAVWRPTPQRRTPSSATADWHGQEGPVRRTVVPLETNSEFDLEQALLEKQVSRAADQASAMDSLVAWLSPVHHHTPAGLKATQLFSRWLGL